MKKTFCNGCGKEVDPRKVKRLTLTEATVPGDDQKPGLGTDKRTEGEVCAECAEIFHGALGENSTAGVLADIEARAAEARTAETV